MKQQKKRGGARPNAGRKATIPTRFRASYSISAQSVVFIARMAKSEGVSKSAWLEQLIQAQPKPWAA